MELTPVSCNHCGASLQVADTDRFVTCRYCNSQLEIKRSESTISTAVLQNIDHNTAAMADDLHALRRESQLERLDREWELRRQNLLVRNQDGSTGVPSAAAGYLFMTFGIIAGTLWMLFSGAIASLIGLANFSHGAPGLFSAVPCLFPLFGVLMIAVSIFGGLKMAAAARTYQQEAQLYQQQRHELLANAPQTTSEI